jgi:DNA-binding NtrC family response regulator
VANALAPAGHRTHRVLVVDDNEDARETLVRLLQLHAFEAVPARSAEDGLRQLHDGFRPCTVILDLCMPGIDGWAFFDRMREDPDLAAIPVIVVSGHLDEMTRAEDRKACRFFLKPANPDDLIATVDEHCEHRHDEGAAPRI